MVINIAVLVIGDGRAEMLERTCQSIARHAGWVDHALMVDDSGDHFHGLHVDCNYPDYRIEHGGRRGMAGAVQAGFDLVLSTPATHVLWVEEDMELIRDLPVRQAIRVMDQHPELAQMCFKREAIDPSEGDDQLQAIVAEAPNWGETDEYTWHDFLFSMNPCVIPRRVLELGWPSGPLGVGNEAGMTAKLLEAGYLFGSWGHPGGPDWARHIGYATRTPGYQL